MPTASAIVKAPSVLYNAHEAGAGVTQTIANFTVPEQAPLICRCHGAESQEKVFSNATAESRAFVIFSPAYCLG